MPTIQFVADVGEVAVSFAVTSTYRALCASLGHYSVKTTRHFEIVSP
jgi:hypothetical protein